MFISELQQEIFISSFQYNNETPEDLWLRVATCMASVEKDKEYWKRHFYNNLKDYKTTLGGRILANAGTAYSGATMLNCYVLGPRENTNGIDSISEIYRNLGEQAMTLKSEGGWGYNFSHLRPRGAYVSGVGIASPGAVKFIELYDKSSEIITAGGEADKRFVGGKKKTRKGAQMGILEVWHPSILGFIRAKQTPGRLTKFNLSVGITSDFMQAVEEDRSWNLVFPDTDDPNYDNLWTGDIKAWKGKTIIYETIRARDLWNTILESTFARNEPGVFFIDNANELNNLQYCERLIATNPCGEIPLGDGDSCLLGSINLVQFLNTTRDDWDYDKLRHVIPIQVRMMDNVVDLTHTPLGIQKEKLALKRRIGMGVLGYGSSLYMLGIRYGSKEALTLTEKLMNFIANEAYKASADLAEEKGSFPLYEERFWESKYVNGALSLETIEYCKHKGMRNSHLLAIAPTGNTSIYCGVVSGGLEPVFAREYTRTSIQVDIPNEMEIPKFWEGEIHETSHFKWYKEGDEVILRTPCPFNNHYYKIDQNRGLTKEYLVQDYGWKFCKDESAAVTTEELSVDDHINTMQIFANYVDQSISKTVNIPHDYPYDDFKDIYYKAWKAGIKGITTYRAGTMTSVLSVQDEQSDVEETIIKENVELPDNYPAKGVVLRAEGKKWYIHMPQISETNRPFALFTSTNASEPTISTSNALEILENLARKKQIPEKWIESLKQKCNKQRNVDKLSRSISLLLRHGVSIRNIVNALGDTSALYAGTFLFQIRKYLSSYISDGTPAEGKCPQCEGNNLIFTQGCKECTDCKTNLCG